MPTFERFELDFIKVPEATLRVRHGGTGPAVLLLHGHPRTHTTWHRVAPILSDSFTVVCPDLRGFGRSSKPADTPDHNGSSKRAKACDCVALMDRLGFERFAVVGHDRGCYTAFRTAMDHRGDQSSRGSRRHSDPGGPGTLRRTLRADVVALVLLRTAGKTRASRSCRSRRLVRRFA
jgi:pimeloyl-ACP methyl ester carboxylesterase